MCQYFVFFFKIFSNFIGYRLQFKGRLNGLKRKKISISERKNTFKYFKNMILNI